MTRPVCARHLRRVDDSWHDARHADDITLRSPRPDELHEFWQPLADAFGESITDDEIERERPLLDFERFVGALDGERWVGTGRRRTRSG